MQALRQGAGYREHGPDPFRCSDQDCGARSPEIHERCDKPVTVQRVEQATGRMYYRRGRKHVRLFAHNRDSITVNDGPVFASQLARYFADLECEAMRVIGNYFPLVC
jgi:hypothetical protein